MAAKTKITSFFKPVVDQTEENSSDVANCASPAPKVDCRPTVRVNAVSR